MNIFASDLDQTLIYSKKWIEEEESSLICMEAYANGSSYMLEKSVLMLEKIHNEFEFIPVTTRTKEQFERINFSIEPKYSICCNGGVLLVDGQVDKVWEEFIQRKLETIEPIEQMLEWIVSQDYLTEDMRLKEASNYFLYLICKSPILAKASYERLSARLKTKNWSLYLQGRKVYLIPSFMTKEAALESLLKRVEAKNVVAAGDSELDFGLKEVVDWFILPGHALGNGDYECENDGLESGHETLEEAYRFLSHATKN